MQLSAAQLGVPSLDEFPWNFIASLPMIPGPSAVIGLSASSRRREVRNICPRYIGATAQHPSRDLFIWGFSTKPIGAV